MATPPESRKPQVYITAEDVEFLTQLVYQIEATEGILADWSLPGAHTESAAYEVARTVLPACGASRSAAGRERTQVQPEVLAYLNRLSDLIWLFGRLIELNAGVDARLRDANKAGPKFSRAW